jgi:PRC-barrel domain protein
MLKNTVTATALAAVLAMPALAQTPTPKQDFVASQDAGGWRGTKLIGSSVYGPDNASIGEITDVLVGNDGKIRAVVVGVSGLLGVTDKDIAIPFAALDIKPGLAQGSIDKISVSYSKEQFRDAPRFTFEQLGSPQTTGTGTPGH